MRLNFWPVAIPVAGIAAGVAAWGAVHPTSQLFGPTLHRTRRRREIALTFDDGPNPAMTPRLLELLARHSVRASFFVVGRFARACPELVRETAARGHVVGNHTETHPNLALLSRSRIAEELARCSDSIAEALGAEQARWMRPPFGYRGPQMWGAVRSAGLRGVVTWSLTCYDWKPQPASRLIERLGRVADHAFRDTGLRSGRDGSDDVNEEGSYGAQRRHSGNTARDRGTRSEAMRGGDVVLLHDGNFRLSGADLPHVLAALEYWLPRWRDAGLKFVTMDEIAGDSPANV